MADIRINALATTAASTASDDFVAVDGSANGTRKLNAYSPTFGGNLTVSGTGTSTFGGTVKASNAQLNTALDPGTYGPLITQTTTGGLYGLFISNAVNASFGVDIPVASTIRLRTNSNAEALSFALGTTETARFAVTTGNFLVGTTTDSGNGKLQLATHTTSAGGIGFGTDTSLYREAAGTLSINHSGGDSRLYFYNAGTAQGRVESASSNFFVTAMAGSLILRSGGATTALTLDSSQHFKLTPAVASSIITTQSAPQIRMGSRASGRSNVVLDSTAGRVWSFENTGTSLTVGYSGLDAVTIAETTGNATFAGSIAIGNTVQTAVGVASTHKVTISIGGSTYYLLATNV
jgi:hypothetical protein